MKKEFRYGKKIQQLRQARAWTQEQLAQVAGCDTRTIQRVEKDLTKNPETLQAIAGAFDVDLENLRTTWLIPESRLVRTWLITSYEQFTSIEQANTWHMCSRTVMAPLTEQGQQRVNELLKQIHADRDMISPSDGELWECYVEQVKEPLESLFDLKFAIFLLSERKDLLLKSNGVLRPEKDHIDDWRVEHHFVVPRHGCFRLGTTEALHRFNDSCPAAGDALFRAIKQCDGPGVQVFANALVAITDPAFFESGMNLCETCFPVLPDGSRLNFEYVELVTGLNRAQWDSLCHESTGEEFLEGLAGCPLCGHAEGL
jgi:transcriptional regulator with XRE-family HTH domain